ncbi:hypothetical protein [Roseibium suaedae]|nr:hypothetical protein [Roseibium suaedae]
MSFKLNDFAVDLANEFDEVAATARDLAAYASSIGAGGAAVKLRALDRQFARCASLAEDLGEEKFPARQSRHRKKLAEGEKPSSHPKEDVYYLTGREVVSIEDIEVIERFLIACQTDSS